MFGNIFLQRCASFALLLLLAGSSVLADDTDVFTGGSSERPQVMIIFDNSGSMAEKPAPMTLVLHTLLLRNTLIATNITGYRGAGVLKVTV